MSQYGIFPGIVNRKSGIIEKAGMSPENAVTDRSGVHRIRPGFIFFESLRTIMRERKLKPGFFIWP